jgi:hypothetical protein
MADPLQKIIFNSLTEEQRVRFDAKLVDPDNLLFDHDYAPKIVSKTTPAPEILHKSETNKNITYTLDTSKHYATRAVIRNVLPALSVKPEYRDMVEICWPPIPALAGFVKAYMQIGETDKFPSWDRHYFDVCLEFQLSNSHAVTLREAGNVPYLTKWNTELPRYEVAIAQPFFEDHSFPLHYVQGSSVTLVYEWNRELKSCIMMRIRNDRGTWKVIKPTAELISKYLEGSLTHINSPDIWINYDAVDPDVLEKERSCIKVGSPEYRYFRSSSLLTDPNLKTYGDTSTITLSTNAPILSVFAFCQNRKAYQLNNPSNFTTDALTVDGYSPIKNVSIKHGDGGVNHFSDLTPRLAKLLYAKHFNGIPEHNNVFPFPFAQRPFSTDVEFGPNTNISKGQISIRVGDGYFYHTSNDSDSDDFALDDFDDSSDEEFDFEDAETSSVSSQSIRRHRKKSVKREVAKFAVKVVVMSLQRYMIHRKSDDKFMITFNVDVKN